MPVITTLTRHLSVAALTAAFSTLAAPVVAQTPEPGTATFAVVVRGVRVGSETVTLSRQGANWLISSTGRLQAPFDLTTSKFELTYGTDWQPQKLTVEALLRGQLVTLGSTFGVTTALSEVMQGGQRSSNSRAVSPRTIVLPANFFAAYEVLAARLTTTTVGTRLPIFAAPDVEVGATLSRVSSKRLSTPSGTLELRAYELTIGQPGGVIPIEIWVDSHDRLARVVMPASAVVVVRDDIASVMTREEGVKNASDEEAFVPAGGFTLASTITKPVGVTGRAPAVILVPGASTQDRDATLYGVAMFGQLAGSLAKAGYFVVRYDKRGLGQSGGRVERAGLSEYAEDVEHLVEWLRDRKDVDSDRIIVVGHAEGGAVALLAASRQKHIKGVALLGAPGRTGREISMDQQQRLLATLKMPDSERAAKVALQQRVIDAAVTGKGWESLPMDIRLQADTAWFKSWVMFDPAATVAKVNQPILIVEGARDTEMPPAYAARLEATSKTRKKAPDSHTRLVTVPGVNHLLVPATTGNADEYFALESNIISPEVASAIAAWAKDVLTQK